MKRKIICVVLCVVLLLIFTSASFGAYAPKFKYRVKADPWQEADKSSSQDSTIIVYDEDSRDNLVSVLPIRVLSIDFILIKGQSCLSPHRNSLYKPCPIKKDEKQR